MKHNRSSAMSFVFYLYILLFGLQCVSILGLTKLTNRNFISFNSKDFDKVEKLLKQFKLTFIEEVTPSMYIFKYDGKHLSKKKIEDIKVSSNGKVINIDVIKQHQIELPDVIYTESTSSTRYPTISSTPAEKQEKGLPYHGMGIEQAWEAGYNGYGIVVAVCDVGVDVGIQDLEHNINIELSHNFVDNSSDLHQEHYYNYVRSLDLTDHGNNCAGLIAAKENENCTTGFAYGSKIAVLKVAAIIEQKWESISDDFIVKALSWHVHEIDVYSCSWQYKKAFVGLDSNQFKALSHGTRCGRNKKGSIYVFPAGAIAEGFSNSIDTIAVSSLNPYGGKPDFVETCACTLTSTYGEGTNYGVSYMKTTSYHQRCKSDFRGTSASTAMVSAMVALALQTNNNLTWRDVQHLIVHASEYEGHAETQNFKTNAAGHHFHSSFGFGLLNATKLVMFAGRWKGIRPQRHITVRSDQCQNADCFQQHKRFAVLKRFVNIDCDDTSDCCINIIEHVVATITYKSSNEAHLGIYLTSPSNTVSILMKEGQSKEKGPTERKAKLFLSVNFWDENPLGNWELSLRQYKFNKENHNVFEIVSFELTIAGTSEANFSHCTKAEDKDDCQSATKLNRPIDTTASIQLANNEEQNIIGPIVIVFVIVVVIVIIRAVVKYIKYGSDKKPKITTETEKLLTNKTKHKRNRNKSNVRKRKTFP